MAQKHLPQVVLVGRPNVGKSTLFNRLSGARRSIVTAIAGTTRDVITHEVTWGEARFDLTDTGGLFGASEDPLNRLNKVDLPTLGRPTRTTLGKCLCDTISSILQV